MTESRALDPAELLHIRVYIYTICDFENKKQCEDAKEYFIKNTVSLYTHFNDTFKEIILDKQSNPSAIQLSCGRIDNVEHVQHQVPIPDFSKCGYIFQTDPQQLVLCISHALMDGGYLMQLLNACKNHTELPIEIPRSAVACFQKEAIQYKYIQQQDHLNSFKIEDIPLFGIQTGTMQYEININQFQHLKSRLSQRFELTYILTKLKLLENAKHIQNGMDLLNQSVWCKLPMACDMRRILPKEFSFCNCFSSLHGEFKLQSNMTVADVIEQCSQNIAELKNEKEYLWLWAKLLQDGKPLQWENEYQLQMHMFSNVGHVELPFDVRMLPIVYSQPNCVRILNSMFTCNNKIRITHMWSKRAETYVHDYIRFEQILLENCTDDKTVGQLYELLK